MSLTWPGIGVSLHKPGFFWVTEISGAQCVAQSPLNRIRRRRGRNIHSLFCVNSPDTKEAIQSARQNAADISLRRHRTTSQCQVQSRLVEADEPPHLTWSTAMFRKRRTENGEQATEAGRDCLEVTAS